ncbi:MAG TPA: R3H domain-containing nucleic acid-binding protein [Patescibacteria group bacterium]|nr:R3H domain-containing nucleic acid-binding protein [Patescibacteria group bacterium]
MAEEKKLTAWLTKLFGHLGIEPKKISISKDDTGTYQAQIDLPDEDAGMMIGYHGDTIAALQLLLGAAHFNEGEDKEWKRVVVNINDYRQKRQESLEQLAQDTAEKVKQSGQPMALFNLNPFERRLVHMALAKDKEIVTQSEGEGKDRHLIVAPFDPAQGKPGNEQ